MKELPDLFDADFGTNTALGRKRRTEVTVGELQANMAYPGIVYAIRETIKQLKMKCTNSNSK